ncbi:MAG: hypothetical protein PHF60_03480 [Candidatus ainarchaeum sp.]|nr:hypothetical protein [Candidatus ainarchaeum sp.]
MAVILAKGRVEEKLAERMAGAGFPMVRKDVLYEHPTGRILCPEEMTIFNRGLDGKRSSFCVFMKSEHDGSVTIQYSNPDPYGLRLSPSSINRRIRLPLSASDSQVSAAVERILKDATKKPLNVFFLSFHEHFGSLSPSYVDKNGKTIRPGMVDYDDGVSFLTDNMRTWSYRHIDYGGLSCHNSVVREPFAFMSWAGQMLGFTAMPGVEVTASFGMYGPRVNGPHFVIIGRNHNALIQVRRAILDMGQRGDMPAYFSGMDFHSIMSILFRLQAANQIIICIAHPFNFNSPSLPVPLVGLYSAVDTGALTLDTAQECASKCDSTAMWNRSLYGKPLELEVKDPELRAFLKDISWKHTGTRRLFSNQLNLALADELHEEYGLHTHYETDEHKALPLMAAESGGYAFGGDSLGMGTTSVEIPESEYDKMEKKPGMAELVDALRSKALSMAGHVFAARTRRSNEAGGRGGLKIYPGRTTIPDELQPMARRYDRVISRRYAGMLFRDFLRFFLSEETEKIKDMTGN